MTTSPDCNLIERDKSFFLQEAGMSPTLGPTLTRDMLGDL